MSQFVISGTGLFIPPHTISNEELVKAFNQYVEKFNDQNATEIAAGEIGLEINWVGEGVKEIGIVTGVDKEICPKVSVGQQIINVDEAYFRPTEVETLLGDPSKAREILGWEPEITVEEMAREMITHDLKVAKEKAHLRKAFP